MTRSLGPILYNTVDDSFGIGLATVLPTEEHVQVLDLPHGSAVASVTAYHDRSDTGKMPEQRVRISVVKRSLLTGEVTPIGEAAYDPMVKAADYEQHHGIKLDLGCTATFVMP
jgi:hypothetical protein